MYGWLLVCAHSRAERTALVHLFWEPNRARYRTLTTPGDPGTHSGPWLLGRVGPWVQAASVSLCPSQVSFQSLWEKYLPPFMVPQGNVVFF